MTPQLISQGASRWSLQPNPVLAPFIDRIWGYDASVVTPFPLLLPGTGSELFFHHGSPPQQPMADPLPAAYLITPRQQRVQLSIAGPLHFIAVRFKSGQLRHFTDQPFAELHDQILPLTQLWGRTTEQLYTRLWPNPGREQQMNLLQRFLMAQLARHHHADAGLDQLIQRLYYAPNLRIEQLADEWGWSRRHLERRFMHAFALTPKYFARLARLQHTVRQMALAPHQALLDLALERGFCDQSHFIHEMRALTGLAPRQLQLSLTQPIHYYPPSHPPA